MTSSMRAGSAAAPRLVALLLALLAAAVAVNRGVFSASISDASGYVAAAELLRHGQLARPVPLQLVPEIRDSGANTSSLGFRPGLASGTEVPFYPLGYPMLMAAAMHVGGELAAFLVAPLMFAVLIMCAFGLADAMAGGAAGLVAAVLVATNPIALENSVAAMSDVPAAACWTAAWYFALRRTTSGACTAGMLVSLACMIRPNLAPLALVPGLLVLTGGAQAGPTAWQWRRAMVFGVSAAVGPLVTAWSQLALYGSAVRPGYPGYETFFSVAHIAPNVRTYPALFVSVFGWVLVAGLAMTLRLVAGSGSRALIGSALGIIVLNGAVYVAYLPYDHWQFLRFFLPATVALTVLFAAGLGAGMATLQRRGLKPVAWLLPLAAAAVIWHSRDLRTYVLNEWAAQRRIPMMGRYLRDVLPPRAVVISYLHSGSVTYCTDRNVATVESLPPARLEAFVANLERYGAHPVLVVDEELEEAAFKAGFKESPIAALDWPARAEFITTGRIRYFVVSDRARYLAGERWVIDVLRP